jgi:catechol 2,3-dioxygenase-like lactoylglutathione lyase family enzyme
MTQAHQQRSKKEMNMHETLLGKYAIKQIAYYVEDLEKAALAHSALFGSGPFVYMDPLTLSSDGTKDTVIYKGQEVKIEKQMAYGHYGDLQIELIQVLSDGPDPYKDMGHYGLHHCCIWVDDFEAAIKDFQDAGFEVGIQFISGGGMPVAFIDCTKEWGHFVEINPPIEGFWSMTKQMADNWDGTNPYKKIGS